MKKQPLPAVWKTPTGTAPTLCLDILKQPHTLIAGTTGSGKSVLINNIVYTALYNAPTEAVFVLIDTKYTELCLYRNLPHTLHYFTDPAAAVQGLEIILDEIRRRLLTAAATGSRVSSEPDIYIIIDELGDLVLTQKKAAAVLGQIAMIGRAAKVHIVAATQNPNRKTLSAEFAGNCPARVGLRCRDAIESRQIIGNADCVNLPIYGQCLYLSPQYKEIRLCAVHQTDEKDLCARVQWWTDQIPKRKKVFGIF